MQNLIRIDDHRAIFAGRMHRDSTGVRVLDRYGRETHFDLAGRFADFRVANDGALVLRHDTGVAIVDPTSGFSMRELRETTLDEGGASWSASFLDVLIDTSRGSFARFELDSGALNHDPETGPTDAVLLPDGRRLAVMIHKTGHIAIFDPTTRKTDLIPLEGHLGASDAVLRGTDLWFNCYDKLGRLSLNTMELKTSAVLQPPIRDRAYPFLMSSAFVGPGRFSPALSNWLVPRPYNADILVVSEETLSPVARIPTGGRPYDAVEFDDGTLLILDHPFDVVRLAHVSDAVPI